MGRLHNYPFVLHKFVTGKHDVELVLPETWQAKDLFDQLQKNLFVDCKIKLNTLEK